MTLEINTRLGPYDIVSLLGVGGMGEVYRARDTRLNRDVAIKVLPAAVAGDPSRRARFAREARSISQLSHPHICTIYDVGEENGIAFLVMEYLDGESLDKRLRRGPLPWATALEWAIQIADAIDTAHRRGIVHRDLKPANVMIAESGMKLLDFGLAKLLEPTDAPAASEPTESITNEQKLLGTLHYMSPEQLEGRDVDARTDVFAFGVTLYEMVTGRKAFDGTSAASVSAAILTSDPAPIALSAAGESGVPSGFDHIIRRALAKHPDERWQTARDLMLELRWLRDGRARAASVPSHRRGPRWLAVAAVSITVAILAGVFGWRFGLGQRGPANPLPMVFTIVAPPNTLLGPGHGILAVSPDGRKVAFVAGPEGGTNVLWWQSLDASIAHVLVGTEDAHAPFWSPDSNWVGFSTETQLKRVRINGGMAQVITDRARGTGRTRGAFWSPDDTIVFAQTGGLFRVKASGTERPVALSIDGDMPRGLPANRWLFLAPDTSGDGGLRILGAGLAAPVAVAVKSNAAFAAGYMVFRQAQALVAQPFDVRAARLTGSPTTIAEDVFYNPPNGRTLFDVSEDLLAYRAGAPRTLTWRDRNSRVSGSIGELGRDWNPAIAPVGSLRVAVDRWDAMTGTFNIWTIDDQGRATQITRGADDRLPTWSPDGKSIVYRSLTPDAVEIRQQSADGKGAAEVLLRQTGRVAILDYSSDGRFLVYQPIENPSKPGSTGTPSDGDDLWVLPLTGDDKLSRRITNTPAIAETRARVSPDGRWIAFSSDEGGKQNIWVQGFPEGGRKSQISSDGGMDPSWGPGGKELYYVALDGTLMAVPVSPASPSNFGTPSGLFKFDAGPLTIPLHLYSATPDGKRFMVSEMSGAPASITVVVNWRSRIR